MADRVPSEGLHPKRGPIEDPVKGSIGSEGGGIDNSVKSSMGEPRGMQQISTIRKNVPRWRWGGGAL